MSKKLSLLILAVVRKNNFGFADIYLLPRMLAETVESFHDSSTVFFVYRSKESKIIYKEKMGDSRASLADRYGAQTEDVNFIVNLSRKQFHSHDE